MPVVVGQREVHGGDAELVGAGEHRDPRICISGRPEDSETTSCVVPPQADRARRGPWPAPTFAAKRDAASEASERPPLRG